ncbi:MAG: hypothetical protein QOG93_1329 [Gaiellaceae bacterium]|nr:hypothetical protein [Gaiellaceae bacterium]
MKTMFHRTKRIVIVLAGAAVLAAGPAASIAFGDDSDNSGPVKSGDEKDRATPAQCQMYKEWYDGDKNANPPNEKSATYYKGLASDRGCKWAQARIAPEERSDPGNQNLTVAPGDDTGGHFDSGETESQPDDPAGVDQGSADGGATATSDNNDPQAKPKHGKKRHRKHHRKHPHHRHR